MRGALALAVCLAFAGCLGDSPAPRPIAEARVVVEGWVLDDRLVPVADATLRVLDPFGQTRTNDEGYYQLTVTSEADIIVVAEAPNHIGQSRAVAKFSGSQHWLNFTLERQPVQAPYDEVQSFQGILRCGVVVTTQEDPSRPHEHQGVRCSQLFNDTANRWLYDLPANTTGVVVEAFWDSQSPLAQALVLKVVGGANAEPFAFTEGTSPIRAQLSSFKLSEATNAGFPTLSITLEPGAGTGNHEHGAAGAFVQQPFDVYATAFFNGPVPNSYTIEDP